VRNAIPPALRFGVVETIAAKLIRPLPAAPPTVLTYADGNFGSTAAPVWRHRPQQGLVLAQWLVAVAGVVAFVLAAPAGRRWPRTWQGGLIAALSLTGLVVVAGAGWAPYGLPALRVIPPEAIARAVSGSIPRPTSMGSISAEQTALAARGQYLYTVALCALCHGNDARVDLVHLPEHPEDHPRGRDRFAKAILDVRRREVCFQEGLLGDDDRGVDAATCEATRQVACGERPLGGRGHEDERSRVLR
jgi:hypothetical protein